MRAVPVGGKPAVWVLLMVMASGEPAPQHGNEPMMVNMGSECLEHTEDGKQYRKGYYHSASDNELL